MISHVAGVASEADDPAPVNDEGSWHLECIADRLLDVMTLSCRLQSSQNGGWPHDLQHGSPLEAEGFVTRSPCVREAGERHLKSITQRLCLLWVALRDSYNVAASSFDVLGALTELLQVLPAEWSAEMPKKGYDDRPRLPEIGNRDLFAVTAAEGNVRCQLAGLNRHILGSSSSLTSIARHDDEIVFGTRNERPPSPGNASQAEGREFDSRLPLQPQFQW